jgi:hypothetical protein
MKIKLLVDLPLEAKHGATKGKIFKLIRSNGLVRHSLVKFWFLGDAGEECAAFGNELEEIYESTDE